MTLLRFGLKSRSVIVTKVSRYIGLLSDLGQKEKSSTYLNEHVVPEMGNLRLRCYGSTTACQAVSVGSTPTSRSEGFKVYLATVAA